jgi:phosphoglycolate phosphatase
MIFALRSTRKFNGRVTVHRSAAIPSVIDLPTFARRQKRGRVFMTQGRRSNEQLVCSRQVRSSMSPARSVLLDLDGTLVDSQPGIFASCLAALRALGHDPGEALDIKHAYRHHYGESGLLGSEPYPGISVALQEMRRAGVRIYLATSKREVFARRILENLKLATYFDGIYGSVPGGELDHKPELLAHILAEQNICASHSLMVGDRRHDIIGAHAVNMLGLGVLWGYGGRDELEAAGADRLVELTSDLARVVLSMLNG